MNSLNQDKQISAKGLAYLVTVYLIWGSTYLAIRFAVREGSGIPPFALGAMRTLVAGSVLLAWGVFRKMRIRLTRSELVTLTLAGLLMWPGANGLVNWAEQRADSSYAALLLGALPIWTALIDSVWRRQRLSGRLLAFLAIGFAGIGLGFSYSWNGVTVKELTVLNTGRYAITTPEYDSVIEEIVEALDDGHEYYTQYWELFSIEVVSDGCCGGTNRLLANTYFNKNETALFGWGMTYLEAETAINATISLSTQLEVSTDGVDSLGVGVEVRW